VMCRPGKVWFPHWREKKPDLDRSKSRPPDVPLQRRAATGAVNRVGAEDCSPAPLTEPDMRARIRLFGLIYQKASDSWSDTGGEFRPFHKTLSDAIRPANQAGA